MTRRLEVDPPIPPSLMLVVDLGEAPIVRLMASTPEAELELREWLALASTRRLILDAIADALADCREAAS
jgi:hypothetical protein